MQKIRQNPILVIILIILAILTLQNAYSILQAIGTPADIALIYLFPMTIITGLLALYVLSRILQNDKPQTAQLKAGNTTLPRTIAIIAATLSACAATYSAFQLINIAMYSLSQPGNSTVPSMFYVYFAIPLVIAVLIFIASVRSLKNKNRP